MRKLLLSLMLLYIVNGTLFAQDCSINAGLSATICLSDTIKLYGTRSGLIPPNELSKWTQISGPIATIVNPDSLITIVEANTPGTYLFKLSNKCYDGVNSEDSVTIIVLPITLSNAGNDTSICPGNYILNGNKPSTNETGLWTVITNGVGVTINSPSNPNSPLILSADYPGIIKLRWTVTNSNGCFSFDDIIITNFGGVSPVNAGLDQTLDNCYAVTTCTKLTATNGGRGFGNQIGIWSFISGPSMPDLSNINTPSITVCNLTTGTYIFRYTVTGPCANGFDDVAVIVPPPNQSIPMISSGFNSVICNGATSFTLTGNNPTYSGEVVKWNQIDGPVIAQISTPNNPSTLVSGLTSPGLYIFQYNIVNSISGCQASSEVRITKYESGIIDGGPDQILPCDVTETTIPTFSTGYGYKNYRIISGPAGAFIYPTLYRDQNSIKGLIYPGTYRVEINYQFGAECSAVNDFVDITVSRTPTGSNAGSSQNFACASNITQLAGNNPVLTGFGSGRWSQVAGPSSALLVNPANYICDVKGTLSGVYTFRWTINGGNSCPDKHKDIIVIMPDSTVTLANAGADKTVCFNSPIVLQGNQFRADETARWTVWPSNGVVFSPSNKFASPTVTGLAANTNYTFTYTIMNSCDNFSTDTVRITTSSFSGPSAADAGSNQCLSLGTNSIQLNAAIPAAGVGIWTQIEGPNSLITNPALPNTSVFNVTNGILKFVWTVGVNGCSNNTKDTVMITVSGNTSIANAGTDVSKCGNSFILKGNFPEFGIGHWTQTSGDGNAVIDSINNPVTNVRNLATGLYTFRWTITNGTCAANYDEITLNMSSPPSVANAGPDQTLCGNTSNAVLHATSPASGSGQWVWVSGPGIWPYPVIANNTSPNASISSLRSGTSILRWIVTGGPACPQSTDDIVINISESANAGADKNLCNLTSTSLKGNAGSSGTWTQISGPKATIVQTPAGNPNANILGLVPGASCKFRYTISSFPGCPSSFDDVIVNNGALTSTPNAGVDDVYCNVTSFNLNGSIPAPGEKGIWSVLSAPSNAAFLPDSIQPNTTVSNAATGTYLLKWTISNGLCSSADVKRVENYAIPTTANAGTDDTLCLTSSILLKANTPENGIGTWTQISGPNSITFDAPNNPASRANGLIAGTYRFLWTISNHSCSKSSDEVSITVLKNVDIATAGNDQNICATSLTLKANTPTATNKGIWSQFSGPNTATISSFVNSETTLSNLIPGIYRFIWKIYNQRCYNTDTVNIVVNPSVNANAGTDDTLCLTSSILLKANTPENGIGTWTQISGPNSIAFDAPNNPASRANGLIAGTYRFLWTISNHSCSKSSDEVSITVLKNVDIATAGNDQNICATSLTLKANTPTATNKGIWSQFSGPNTATISSFVNSETTLSNLIPGIYRFIWKIYNQRCYNTDTVNIVVNPSVNVNAGEDFTVCNKVYGIPLSGASVSGYIKSGSWSVVSGEGVLSNVETTSNPSGVLFYPSNNYTGPVVLRLSASDNCHLVTDDVVIFVAAPLLSFIDAVNDATRTDPNTSVNIDVLQNDKIISGETLKLTNGSIITAPAHGTAMVNSDGTITYKPLTGYLGIDSFNYKLNNNINTDDLLKYGCYSEGNDNAWVYIMVEGCILPNAFSPDGDGVNDTFEIPCARGDVQFSVFNRWGIEVYRNDQYTNQWDGTYNNVPLPDGTYFYILNYSSDNISKLNKDGFITLRR
jgi:gliding motility-associated-like protein